MTYKGVPVFGFVGFSGSGKTTILTQVIDKLQTTGVNVAVIKHTHHHFDIDKPGKDSYKFRASGAQQVIVGSKKRFALMVEMEQQEPDLTYLMSKLELKGLDLILFEGFKHEKYPKFEVHRKAMDKPWLFRDDDSIIAVVTDADLDASHLPVLGLNDVDGILDVVLNRV